MATDEQPRDDGEQFDIHLTPGLSPEQAAEAMRIFAALRATRQERDDRVGAPGVPTPLCPVRLTDGTPCFLPLPHDEHRELGSGGEDQPTN